MEDDNIPESPFIYRLVSTICISAGIGIIFLMIWSKVDDATGWIGGSVFSLGFLIFGVVNGLRANRIRDMEKYELETLDVKDDAAINKAISVNKKRLYILLVITISMSIAIIGYTNRLENGSINNSYKGKNILMGVIEVVYGLVGYWPIVAIIPVMGASYALNLLAKILALISIRDSN